MKRWVVFLSMICFAAGARGETQITMTGLQVMQTAREMIDAGNLSGATDLLAMTPQTGDVALEIERWFLFARIAQIRGDIDRAIEIYRKILDDQPNLARVRYELALCYMKKHQWYRADYHLRLAMADGDLAPAVRMRMQYLRYVIRKNKNWNVWFNMGAAPDSNINGAAGGTECIDTIFGSLCRELDAPQSVIGYNAAVGGDYEFKLGDAWRWKTAVAAQTDIYDIRDYDDLYLNLTTGPRYVFERGSVWLGAMGNRRYYGWSPYMASGGATLNMDYDFTSRLTVGVDATWTRNTYDDFGAFLNGNTFELRSRATYAFDASKYMTMRAGVARETAVVDTYANWQAILGAGFGAELPYGFSLYLDVSGMYTIYDGPRWVVSDGWMRTVTERSFISRYGVQLSNNKLSFAGFVPAISYTYTRRDSNVWQREFSRHTVGFNLRRRF